MQTRLDCLVCFMRQALSAVRLCSDDPLVQRRVIDETGRLLARIDLDQSPPENAVSLYGLIAELTDTPDPFAELKRQANTLALALRDHVEEKINAAADPLRAAIRHAACGNIIDYAAQHGFNAADPLQECDGREFVVDDYDRFCSRLQRIDPAKILYLADNSGEIVFDGLLIQRLQERGAQVTLAVRGEPIINDATRQDITACGMDSLCRVIDNGTGCPGTPLGACSEEFQEVFLEADCIISKGMGNFETLSDVQAPLFFLFMVKCERVVEHLREAGRTGPSGAISCGDMIFMQQQDTI